ncbi:methylmalonate-semialdehyde dehydrogenasE (MmsA) [Sphaerisporangium krabiense]|uniref:methylmalonate-semialdehyde dehydrogenase (CoA acylating) n=1 Tax=Sphaerisporangium krabiense TaxID=763782 RepID=A0A7W8Z9D0_9ACTN|nr:CoA-acylating methylmalonate-semialdehyde dehydrogenase [Sphaerisporangium krabiense]MBB5629777.1 malonate-semialdehyde dehydrogenase (acetylating)/methylmalonate-semialdehyde dehydrogenase [Sphaerisporangium krabiense]GII63876.1 methylmalonate-semialdehyde dehydrogenasE (MmsA) [Sphaerisporangium krabiense]
MTDPRIDIVEHVVAGDPMTGVGERLGPVYDPALGVETKKVRLAAPADVDAAVGAAAAAFPRWRDMSWARRQTILFNFRESLNRRKNELAEIITSEHGKVLSDALAEISRGQEVLEFALAMPQLAKGGYSENVSTGVDAYSLLQPLGVVGIVSPFNFPVMVPMWFLPIALATGNTVVLKPSEKDPSAANWIADLLKEAGLPDGVFNVLHGDKVAVDGLLDHEEVRAISFVGSTPIARYVYERATRAGKRVQALGGAKNHMLVLADADLNLAADAAINAAFGSAGERCMAISVLAVADSVADDLIGRIAARMDGITVGDGRRGCDMGPLVTREHRDKVTSYIEDAERDGSRLVVDGRGVKADGDEAGFWLGPTLVDRVEAGSRLYTDEIFGPVLSVVRVRDLEEGIGLINGNAYGNGTAIFTTNGGAARRFQREVQVGMIGINIPIPVPVSYYSFGGWKQSFFGDTKAYGAQGVHFFTQEKAVTSRWPDPVPDGDELNLGFPQNS